MGFSTKDATIVSTASLSFFTCLTLSLCLTTRDRFKPWILVELVARSDANARTPLAVSEFPPTDTEVSGTCALLGSHSAFERVNRSSPEEEMSKRSSADPQPGVERYADSASAP